MNTFDLQIQSTASDGKHSPREIVQMAKEVELQIISITDHDTVGGVEEAILAGGEFGVRVIPGIEMSVEDRDLHLLGFGIDFKNVALREELGKFQMGRIEGAKRMVENLKAAGFVVEWSDVLREATGGVVARPHIARAILNRLENKEKLGDISSTHDFIEAHLSNASPNYVRRTHISAKKATELLHHAGGVVVWSHPAIHFPGGYEGLEKFLKALMRWGIDGIEVFNPSHTEDDVEFLQGLAVKYNLLRTAGSDFHEKGDHSADPRGLHSARTVGDYETHGFPLDDIIPNLDLVLKKRRGSP